MNVTVEKLPARTRSGRGSLSRLWAILSDWLFARPEPIPEEPFPDLVTEIEAEALGLEAHARESGAAELPAHGTARSATFEPSIDNHVRQLFGRSRKRVEAKFAGIDAKIRSIDLKRREAELETIRERLDADCGEVLTDSRRDLAALAGELSEATQELERFRSQHALHRRAAVYPASVRFGVSLLCALVLLESLMNGFFFAEGSERGLVGGFGEAVVISLVNILIAGFVAHWPLRWTGHARAGWRWIGRLLCLVYFAALAAFLLLITLYRDAFTLAPDDATRVAWRRFTEFDWQPNDMGSLLFLALSLLFALIAIVDVWRLDDPYPGYGAVHRRRQKAQYALDDERDKTKSTVVARRHDREAQLDRLATELETRTALIEAMRNDHARIRNLGDSHRSDLLHLHGALIGQFRQLNTQARSTPPPAWFVDSPPELGLDSMIDDVRELPDIDAIRAGIDDLQSRTATLGIDLSKRYSEAIEMIDRDAAAPVPVDAAAGGTDAEANGETTR